MELLVVCFCISEVLLYSIRAVDYMVLERKVMVMEVFTWTRYYTLHPSESSESSGVSFDNGSLKAPSSPVGWDYDKINITESPSCCCRLFSIQRDWDCLAALHSTALLLSQILVPAKLLLLSCLPWYATAKHSFPFLWQDSILFSRPAAYRRREKLCDWVMESSPIRQRIFSTPSSKIGLCLEMSGFNFLDVHHRCLCFQFTFM